MEEEAFMTKKRIVSVFVALVMVCSAFAMLVACKEPAELTEIKVTKEPTKTTYIAGEKFDPAGMVISAIYNDESTKELATTDWTYSPTDELKVSTRNITVTYKEGEIEKTVKQAITVTNDVTEVSIKTHATKLSYLVGEKFNPAGMVLTVKYQNGETKEVVVADDAGATYNKEGLTANDKTVTVTYGGKSVTEEITIAKGVFIEAEDGLINGVSIVVADEGRGDSQKYIRTDAAGKTGEEAKYNASGDKYLGEVVANDTVTFVFKASAAGKASISFRMASKYLKEDSNWTPIWMGDCQFNKICEVYVNDVKYEIPDSVVLPGGGESGGTPNANLWLNWQEVPFENIDIVEGINEIDLKFIPHDYNDCSQSAFNGTFTSNIDSLIVTADVDIEPVEPEQPEPPVVITATITPVSGKLEEADGKAYVVISGTISGDDYTKDELKEILRTYYMDFQKNGYNNGAWNGSWDAIEKTATKVELADDGSYSCWYDITDLDEYLYTTHYGLATPGGDNKGADFKPAEAYDKTVTIGERTYHMFVVPGSNEATQAWGNIGLEVTGAKPEQPDKPAPVFTNTVAKLVVDGEKAYLVVESAYENYSDEDAKKYAESQFKDMQTFNQWSDSGAKLDASKTTAANGKASIYIDITNLSAHELGHMAHFLNPTTDLKVAVSTVAAEVSISLNGKTYTLSNYDGSGNGLSWAKDLTLVKVTTKKTVTPNKTITLEESNGKMYLVLNGTYEDYTVDELKAALAFDAETTSWKKTEIDASKVNVTVDEAKKTFVAKVDISDLAEGQYLVHLYVDDIKIDIGNENGIAEITCGDKTYSYVNHDFGTWKRFVLTIKAK